MSDRTFIYCYKEEKTTEAIEGICISCGKPQEEIFAMAPAIEKSKIDLAREEAKKIKGTQKIAGVLGKPQEKKDLFKNLRKK